MITKDEFIYGVHPVFGAVESGKAIDKVLWQKGLRGEGTWSLMQLLRQKNIPVQTVPPEKLNAITRANHQGVIALLSIIEFTSLDNLLPGLYEKGETPFILILDRITDVRNFGAIARTAECAGVHALIIPEKGSARIGADAVKTSAGALMNIPVCKSNMLPETLQYLKDSGLCIVAATEKASELPGRNDFNGPLAILMGSEESGISEDLLRLADKRIRIPVYGKTKSLNVSVAAGIFIYEALRQRGLWQ